MVGFVAGEGVKSSAAVEAAKIKGVEKVVAVENTGYEKVRKYGTFFPSFSHEDSSLMVYYRAYPRTTPPYSWKILKAEDTHMSLLIIQPSERVFYLASRLCLMCNKFLISPLLRAKTVC